MDKPKVLIIDWKDKPYYRKLEPYVDYKVSQSLKESVNGIDALVFHAGLEKDEVYDIVQRSVAAEIPIIFYLERTGGWKDLMDLKYPKAKCYYAPQFIYLVETIKELFNQRVPDRQQ